jgi:hypothetical protein
MHGQKDNDFRRKEGVLKSSLCGMAVVRVGRIQKGKGREDSEGKGYRG